MFDSFSRVKVEPGQSKVTNSNLITLRNFIEEGNSRLDIVNVLAATASCLVSDAVSGMICESPELISPGGNCYTNSKISACLRDGEIILRYISYALLAGDSSILETRCLNGLKETYVALGVPTSSIIRAVALMKSSASTIIENRISESKLSAYSKISAQSAMETGKYFDKVINAIS
uniref:R-phycoerythrin class I beta subunit n=1 Tax=Chroothece richteriana TaxID=101928 RepID=UPI001FCDDF45|nr:R-phycoerythrin class I beta subunit [Chroothece richteriana]UNJ14284.1 R-phycoerythrin class I beta subunit [Chroothece richteriana]